MIWVSKEWTTPLILKILGAKVVNVVVNRIASFMMTLKKDDLLDFIVLIGVKS